MHVFLSVFHKFTREMSVFQSVFHKNTMKMSKRRIHWVNSKRKRAPLAGKMCVRVCGNSSSRQFIFSPFSRSIELIFMMPTAVIAEHEWLFMSL